jgi:ABC-type transport system involved in multi-copper enzyme maturation permease subunit
MPRLRDIFRHLDPLAVVLGPTFQKEVRVAGRRRGTYWLRALTALGLLIVTAFAFSSMRSAMGSAGRVQRLQMLQQLAPYITMVVIWFQFVALFFVAPILTAPAVCDEKRARTLAALMTTPLTSAQVAFGMLASRVVQLTILALLAAPLLLAVRVFGGLEAGVVLAATSITLSTALLGAALGLMFSVRHRRATTAGLTAMLTLALVQGGPLLLYAIIYSGLDSSTRGEFDTRAILTCSPATLGIVNLGMFGEVPPGFTTASTALFANPVSITQSWILNSLYNVLLAGMVMARVTATLRRVMIHQASFDGGPAPARRRRATAMDTPSASTDPPLHTSPGRIRQVSDRPVLWREVRQSAFGSRRKFLVILGLTVAVLLFLYARFGLREEGVHHSIAIIGAIFVVLHGAFMTVGGISSERDARTWDVLLTTPLTARQIILGKFLGTLRAQWFLPAVVHAHLALAVIVGAVSPIVFLHLPLIYLGPAVLLSATGVLLSLFFRKGTVAASCNLGIMLALYAASWLIVALIAWFLDMGWNSSFDLVWDACFAVNPVPMAVSTIDPALHPRPYEPQTRSYHLAGESMGLGSFTMLVIGVFVGYLTVAAGVLVVAVGTFRRLSGRSS